MSGYTILCGVRVRRPPPRSLSTNNLRTSIPWQKFVPFEQKEEQFWKDILKEVENEYKATKQYKTFVLHECLTHNKQTWLELIKEKFVKRFPPIDTTRRLNTLDYTLWRITTLPDLVLPVIKKYLRIVSVNHSLIDEFKRVKEQIDKKGWSFTPSSVRRLYPKRHPRIYTQQELRMPQALRMALKIVNTTRSKIGLSTH